MIETFMKSNKTILEEIMIYSEDCDNSMESFKSIIVDFFDLPNRLIPLLKKEKKFIKRNLTKETQIEIFGIEIN